MDYQNCSSGALAQHTSAQWPPDKVKILKMSQGDQLWGPMYPPNLADGGKLFYSVNYY